MGDALLQQNAEHVEFSRFTLKTHVGTQKILNDFLGFLVGNETSNRFFFIPEEEMTEIKNPLLICENDNCESKHLIFVKENQISVTPGIKEEFGCFLIQSSQPFNVDYILLHENRAEDVLI